MLTKQEIEKIVSKGELLLLFSYVQNVGNLSFPSPIMSCGISIRSNYIVRECSGLKAICEKQGSKTIPLEDVLFDGQPPERTLTNYIYDVVTVKVILQ